jgi:saccharopine dehydrogenase-like protein
MPSAVELKSGREKLALQGHEVLVVPVVIFGGYGTFGSQVACELVRLGLAVTVAGRDLPRAAQFATELGPSCQAMGVDVRDRDACRGALDRPAVAVNCAGPFRHFDATLLDACLEMGCHYADIADDRTYVARVRSCDAAFRAKGLAAIYGCSSLPGISGALALHLREQSRTSPRLARVTLFIGNRNAKGMAAMQSCIEGLGRPISAPQGSLRGFCDREIVPLPRPFGSRAVYNFDTPEYDLFPELLKTSEVRVKLGFESRLGTWLLATLARCGSGYGRRTTQFLRLLAWPFQRFGCSGGAVMTEFFYADGTSRRAAVVAPANGQRMAALPCALVARELATNPAPQPGVATAYEFLGARPLLEGLRAAGFELHGGD